MKDSSFTRAIWFFVVSLISSTLLLNGQGVTSAGIRGQVTTEGGNPISGAVVKATHLPTGTIYTAVTREGGYYGINGVRVGGPYTITVTEEPYSPATATEVYTELGKTQEVGFVLLSGGEIQELEAFTITGDDVSLILNSNTTGAKSTLNNDAIETIPQVRRSLNDFAKFNPYASITEDDRNELTVAGQNNRFNNVQIDGVRTNDQFGLNSNGVGSFNNPVATDAIEQITVEVSPYTVTQSGFTGGSINAVTKSGTNRLSGSVYTYYTDDNYRGDDPTDGSNSLFREWTWGATLGGPIIKDKLFYFISYEEFERTEEPGSPGFIPDPTALQQVIDYGNNVLGADFGTFSPPDAAVETDEKILAKIDWNLNDNHRANLTYRKTEGVNPNFGNFDDFGEAALSTNFYRQLRDETSYVGQLFSTWNSDFQTEIRVAYSEFRQPTNFDSSLPQIEIDSFPGADGDADAGELFLGTERFRHANNLEWDTLQIAAIGNYYWEDFKITFGFDYESTEFSNLFLADAFGNFTFENTEDTNGNVTATALENFLNDVDDGDSFRNTGIEGQNPIAAPEITVTGLFVENEWYVNDRLTLTGGIRIDTVTSDTVPPTAQGFEAAFGFPNNGDIDGQTLVAPRFSFNYALNEDRTLQVRGGIGLFQGRAPGVWIANAFTNNGETAGRIDLTNGLADYMQNDFDPNDPIVFVPRQDSTPEVNATEDGFTLPSVWRYNLALDWELNPDWIVTAEVLITDAEDAIWYENANQPIVGTAPDGRDIYDDGGVSSDFRDVFVLRNTEAGKAENFSLQIQKRNRGKGFFGSASWTYGKSEDVNPFTSSRAVSNWRNRAGFNFNRPELGTSNFEVRHRFLATFGYTHEWTEDIRTTAILVYEGREGRPYSYAFDDDINGDGESGNDLFYVPTGPNDPLVTFEPTFPVDDFFSFLEANGLSQYAGGAVPRNSHNNPWVHTLDLKVVQELPVWNNIRAELFFDFKNLGNWINDDWGLVSEAGFPFILEVADASIVGNQYNFTDFDPEEIRTRVGRYRSRWNLQVGAKIKW